MGKGIFEKVYADYVFALRRLENPTPLLLGALGSAFAPALGMLTLIFFFTDREVSGVSTNGIVIFGGITLIIAAIAIFAWKSYFRRSAAFELTSAAKREAIASFLAERGIEVPEGSVEAFSFPAEELPVGDRLLGSATVLHHGFIKTAVLKFEQGEFVLYGDDGRELSPLPAELALA